MTWVPAFDLAVTALLHTAIVIAGLSIRHLRRRGFSLGDLLLAVLVVSLVCALLVSVPRYLWRYWPSLLWYGVGFGLITLYANHVATRNWTMRGRLIAA